jgi:serine/threonine-protein kinase
MASGDSSCPRCGTAVAADARFCPSCGLAAARLVPGQTLDGKYEILDKIGEGGMGEVYRARHVHLDEIRIIKVTKPDPLGEGSEPRRFQEEARIATLVRHPNVAALYDFSRMPDGASYYMVWEFINGITLEAWLKKYGPLPVARALDVAQQVLAGLAEIHAQGIVHRDLSPDNIMLKELPDGRLQAKIIDLGIAKRVAAESLQMTGTGMFVGKLKYCSPEQAGALPRGQTVDGRSDLYSFGVVLYEMLSGRPPFESQTPEGYLGMHLHQAPPPLDTTRVPPRIAPALAAAVTKALEKPREKRFKDAREFSDALGRLVPAVTASVGQTESAPTVPVRSEARGARSAWTVTALAVAVAAAAVWAISRREHAPASEPVAVAAPTPAPPALRPTETIDEVVAARPSPRVIEGSTTEIGVPRPQATGPAAGRPTAPPTAVPTPLPTPVPAAAPDKPTIPEPSAADANNPEKARQRLNHWMSRPVEDRARRSVDIARWANKTVAEHPDNPNVRQMTRDLPLLFKGEALAALDRKQPFVAAQFYRAYLMLDFAPADPELTRRMNAAPNQRKPR